MNAEDVPIDFDHLEQLTTAKFANRTEAFRATGEATRAATLIHVARQLKLPVTSLAETLAAIEKADLRLSRELVSCLGATKSYFQFGVLSDERADPSPLIEPHLGHNAKLIEILAASRQLLSRYLQSKGLDPLPNFHTDPRWFRGFFTSNAQEMR